MRRRPKTPSISGRGAILLTSLIGISSVGFGVYDTFFKDLDQRDCPVARCFQDYSAYQGSVGTEISEVRCDFENFVRNNYNPSQSQLDPFLKQRNNLALKARCPSSLEEWNIVGAHVDYVVTSDANCGW